jgi:hypothetical protein
MQWDQSTIANGFRVAADTASNEADRLRKQSDRSSVYSWLSDIELAKCFVFNDITYEHVPSPKSLLDHLQHMLDTFDPTTFANPIDPGSFREKVKIQIRTLIADYSKYNATSSQPDRHGSGA